ncbi:MAG: crosslink repair DNA glycosylase YcaQ family protein [Pseudomonadota bacterium]
MRGALPRLDNASARRLFLTCHGLTGAPIDLMDLIRQLGFVQVDSINTVERAHHMILAARQKSYRPKHLKRLLEKDRALFEHWTHDAAVIPTEFFPHWRLRFARDAQHLIPRWQSWRRDGFQEKFDAVLDRIASTGPVMARDVGEGEQRGSGGWWDWHPSKTALEFLWRTGKLSVTRREGFQKVFDLTEQVIPKVHLTEEPRETDSIDWACKGALDRLGFATSGEIAAFWDAVTPAEAKNWCQAQLGDDLIEIEVEGADGALRRVFARPDVMEQAANAPEAPGRLRVLSPFDPALRDRKRAERLFGFHYRIEVFVPEARRKYGYYVFPLMEGDRLIGRIDMKRRSERGCLEVRAFWPERRIALGKSRMQRLEAELARWSRLSGCGEVVFCDGWQRESLG